MDLVILTFRIDQRLLTPHYSTSTTHYCSLFIHLPCCKLQYNHNSILIHSFYDYHLPPPGGITFPYLRTRIICTYEFLPCIHIRLRKKSKLRIFLKFNNLQLHGYHYQTQVYVWMNAFLLYKLLCTNFLKKKKLMHWIGKYI